ncbi:MAG: hypothetical protein A2133_07710 [Actinobacteria bacterium RBG_16_64_13]|nr:MAG: hypothetical protein A2133_07710 [Actinobacteria bacterium RBG_16_64_13]
MCAVPSADSSRAAVRFLARATPDGVTTPSRPTPIIDLVDRLSCPLFAVFGEEDQNPSPKDAAELRARLEMAGKDAVVKVYPNAGHAFLADYRSSYREAAASELWADAVSFFERNLRS